jgi:hypothetical protein
MDREDVVGRSEESSSQGITRKEALRKTGYAALSAATMMLLMGQPDKALAASGSEPAPPGGDPW